MRCKKCKNQPGVSMIGQCSACPGHTPSASDKYCDPCAKKLNKCARCGKKV